ncbi:unnamed protein product [Toxocara canis]|uniref:Dynein light chain n=1 Tax=Toxocara canis TaxID=6265 RepID=A0A183V3A6_TOXCA|nr:unnamed protein product [Toxocara canis]
MNGPVAQVDELAKAMENTVDSAHEEAIAAYGNHTDNVLAAVVGLTSNYCHWRLHNCAMEYVGVHGFSTGFNGNERDEADEILWILGCRARISYPYTTCGIRILHEHLPRHPFVSKKFSNVVLL